MKKNLLIFCDFYFPSIKAGGPLRSISAIVNALKNNFQITIVTRNHDLCEATPYNSVPSDQMIQQDDVNIIYCSRKNTLKNIRTLLREQWDVIYFNSFFSPLFSVIPQVFLCFSRMHFKTWAPGRTRARIIISPRGELGHGAIAIKSPRKKAYLWCYRHFYRKNNVEFLAASTQEKQEITAIFHGKFPVTQIENLISIESKGARGHVKLDNQLKIIFVSRVCEKKNLLFAIDVLLRASYRMRFCKKITEHSGAAPSRVQVGSLRVQFDIYGLLEEKNYWVQCERKIAQLPDNIQVNYCGELHPDDVVTTMQQYDLFFLPTKNENYGYVIVEELAAGLPVLLSDQTPWKNLTENHAGWTFPLSQPLAFSEKISALAMLSNNQFEKYHQGARQYYKKNIVSTKTAEQYQQFFESNHAH